MKPAEFAYTCPRTVEEALDCLKEFGDEARILAGGQSLIPLLNLRLCRPSWLVDINHLNTLDYVKEEEGWLRIGALARHRDIEVSPVVRSVCPILSYGASLVGHLAVRNRGTMAGSLSHAHPAAEFPALCLLLEARLKAMSVAGTRTIPADEFVVDLFTTALTPGELLAEIAIPVVPPRVGWGLEELATTQGGFALGMVAALVSCNSAGECEFARIVLAGVGPRPVRAHTAENHLLGSVVSPARLSNAARLAAEELNPLSDTHASADYRRQLVRGAGRAGIALCPQQGWKGKARERGMSATSHTVRLRVNGRAFEKTIPARKLLSDFLREDLGLTGTHVGCEQGICGACTVLCDGRSVRSCLLLAVQAEGAEIVTVEGLERGDKLHPLQQAFWENHAVQCGFCTPGFLLTAYEMLSRGERLTLTEIRHELGGNLCRCTGYEPIVKAVFQAIESAAEVGVGSARRSH